MDPFTVAAICTLILKGEAAVTAVPPSTNCAAVVADARASAARAATRVQNDDDHEGIARVAWAEAANQGDRGLAAVVFTIINRLGDGRWGRSVSDVLNARKQFEPVLKAGGDWRNLPPVPPSKRPRVDAIVALALRGELADETGGALYFQNPTIVAQRERAGLVSRGLTHFGGKRPSVVIGDHAFYTEAGTRKPRPDSPANDDPDAGSAAEAERQRAFIEAGGAIFGQGNGEAFDTAEAPRRTQPVSERPKEIDSAESKPTGEQIAMEARPTAPTVEERQSDDASGGMFVLPNGRTSTAPPDL